MPFFLFFCIILLSGNESSAFIAICFDFHVIARRGFGPDVAISRYHTTLSQVPKQKYF